MVKLPSKSVIVAFWAFAFSTIVAPITASPFSSITVPFVWAIDATAIIIAASIRSNLLFFIAF